MFLYLYLLGFLVLTLVFLCLTRVKKLNKNNVIMCLVFFSIFVYITNLIIIGKHKDELNKRNNTKSLTIINDELVLGCVGSELLDIFFLRFQVSPQLKLA